MKFRKSLIAVVGIVGVFALSACGQGTPEATQKDQASSAQALAKLQIAQPVPQFDWSQYRQTLIDVENAEANSIQTTSFFFNQGVQDPYFVCPSIGFPIASTTQLTSPDQAVDGSTNGSMTTIAQVDPTGVFTGNSSGTYVLCVNSNGVPYAQYAEAFVHTVSAAANWNSKTHQIDVTGAPTYKFKTSQNK